MKFTKTENTATIDDYRKELYQRFTAPIDAMWEQLYISSSQAYLIESTNQNIGYCCINDQNCLTQIFLIKSHNHQMGSVIQTLIDDKIICSASLSSIEPVSFNACLHLSKSINTNTFCFKYSNRPTEDSSPLNIELASEDNIETIRTFLMDQIGFDDTFGYTENLVNRKEMYMVKESENLIATSELRLSDSQPNVADLGVIVNKDYRGKGLATNILHQQANKAQKANRNPICSTTLDNPASKKAIERAGFYCSSIIYDICFTDSKTQE
jgi:predicted acetyltransferase